MSSQTGLAPEPPPAPWRDLLAWTPGPSSLGDAREFLQRRVRLYLGFLSVLFSAFFIVDAGEQLVEKGLGGLESVGIRAHLGLVVGVTALWGWLRVRNLWV